MKENEEDNGINPSSQEIDQCISVIENLVKDTQRLVNLPTEQRIALLKVAGELSRPHRAEIKNRNKTLKNSRRLAKREKNRRARETTGIRHARTHAIFSAPKQIALHAGELEHEGEKLSSPRNCYICKEEFSKLHFFYDTLCKKCADLNYSKRFQTASLQGQVAFDYQRSRENWLPDNAHDAACRRGGKFLKDYFPIDW